MNKSILFAIGIFSFQLHAFQPENHLEYYEVGAPEIREVRETSSCEQVLTADSSSSALLTPIAQPAEIGWDEIVNIGSRVWQIIEDNKPVLHTEMPLAHALPKGLRRWTELERWSAPETKTYEVLYKNKFGMEVVKFRFRLQYTHGGRLNGRGRYLANVSILNSQTDVIWGYTFNARVEVRGAVNLGTKSSPLAGLELNLHWNVKTVVKESENSVHFFVDGNGQARMAQ